MLLLTALATITTIGAIPPLTAAVTTATTYSNSKESKVVQDYE